MVTWFPRKWPGLRMSHSHVTFVMATCTSSSSRVHGPIAIPTFSNGDSMAILGDALYVLRDPTSYLVVKNPIAGPIGYNGYLVHLVSGRVCVCRIPRTSFIEPGTIAGPIAIPMSPNWDSMVILGFRLVSRRVTRNRLPL